MVDVADLPEHRIPKNLALCALGLAFLYLATRPVERFCVTRPCELMQQALDMNGEGNLPAWFTVLCWFLAGILSYCIAQVDKTPRQRIAWYGVMVFSFFISFDEMTMFHETFGSMMGTNIGRVSGVGDIFFYKWLIYGVLFAITAGFVFLPFLYRLPQSTSRRIVMACAVFLSGAIGVEFLGAASEAGAIDLVRGKLWLIAIALEETLEMLGVILFVSALLHHLSLNVE
ncbi:hypothetical protein [Paracoccus hibiscisoli]|uniref:hypothetical protein n=1 Tax=Paracoccus hibiscisoli TaxID=2023261 RepID=UPI0023F2BDD4|nr:hypothetical protein [Paracoccus hibiscisoli]